MNRIYKRLILALILAVSISYSYSQTITGKLVDSLNQPIQGATVVLRAMDNSILTGVISNFDGSFEVRQTTKGSVKLTINFVGFTPYIHVISLDQTKNMELGKIKLVSSATNLKEILVIGDAPPVQVKGDTTEYNASAFKTEVNATSEDLVKKMPGMEVVDGKVKAQGEDVKRVIVDGKQFFGDDPMLALRNLPADVVDKVQLIDAMSDQSQFTRFDDGERVKTLNIVTKQNRRKGYFGRVSAGTDGDSKYSVGGNVSNFNGDRRISINGTFNNTNEMNFGMQDFLGAMGSSTMMMGGGGMRGGGGGGMRGGGGGGGAMRMGGFGQGNGYNTTHSLGLNYSDILSPKLEVSGSYFYNMNNNENLQLTDRTYLGVKQFANLKSDGISKNYNHRFNARIDYNIDSSNSITFRPTLSFQDNSRYSLGTSATQDSLYKFVNSYENEIKTKTDGYNYSGELTYRHRFAKQGRTFSIGINSAANNNNSDSYQKSIDSSMYRNILTVTPRNQNPRSKSDGYSISTNFSFTEPITKSSILMINYNFRYNSSNSDKFTYDYYSEGDIYNQLIDSLSNSFDNLNTAHRVGLNYKILGKKSQLTIGMNYQRSDLGSKQQFPETYDLNHSFDNWLPTAQYQYKFSKNGGFEINYNTSTRAPSLTQLQNVLDNSDPTRISEGNPELKQEYTHNIVTRINLVKPQTARTFMFLISGSILTNRIANSTIIAQNEPVTLQNGIVLNPGSQYTKPVNISNPYWNFNTFLTLGQGIFKQKLNVNYSSGLVMTIDPGLVNNLINTSNTYNITQRLNLASNISQKIDFNLSGSYNYNIVKYTSNPDQNSNYSSVRLEGRLNWVFYKGIFINSTYTYSTNSGLSDNYNTNYSVWNASIGTQLFKNKSGEIKLTCYDILNSNNSITRNVTQLYFEDVRSLTLKQYFMLSFTYNLRKFGGQQMGRGDERERNRMMRDRDEFR